jgi:hypothetical protein
MRIFLTLMVCLSTTLCAQEADSVSVFENEIEVMGHLIDATQQKLDEQQALKKLMIVFQEQQERFFRGDQSKEHASRMVHSARQILDLIKDAHLTHLFTSEYLEELTLFSSIAGKSAPK